MSARGSWPRLLGRLFLAPTLLVLAVAGWVAGNAARATFHERLTPEQAAPAGGRWVHAHDVELHVVEHGNPRDPTLVLVAGTGAWAGTWISNLDAMLKGGWRVVAVDLPPFGYSHRPQNSRYARRDQALRLLAAIRTVSPVSPVVLLGHSYGGGPAAEAAMLDPARIRQLILVDAAISMRLRGAPACDADGADPLAGLLGWRPLRTALIASTGTQPLFAASLLRRFVARTEVVVPSRTALYQQPQVVQESSAALGDWALQFATDCGDGALSRTPAGFAGLGMPLTLLWGELDTVTPPQQARDIAATAPNARVVMLPGVGHIPQIEDPAAFDRQLGEVLRSIRL